MDRMLGEVKYFHPLVGFGNLAHKTENLLNRDFLKPWQRRVTGFISWSILVLPLPLFYWLIDDGTFVFRFFDVIVVYLAIGLQSLKQHARNIAKPLQVDDLPTARKAASYMVSRHTQSLSAKGIARAAVESVLENGHDAVIATIFWYLVGGAPLVIVHRLANTLDAMWGYRTTRFYYFGWFAARADDCLGWPSAKLTGILYILSQMIGIKINTEIKTKPFQLAKIAFANAMTQSKVYKSYNGGWVMASGATMLGIQLGGQSEYHGKTVRSSVLGKGRAVEMGDIEASLSMVSRAAVYWLGILVLVGLSMELVQ